MDSLSVQGTSISLSAGNSVAVDTGTTLIGGPSDTVRLIYEAIDGARQMTGNYRNYYEYPCTANVDITLTFGGYNIHVTDRDFNLGRYGSDPAYCTGAIFVQALPQGSPIQWIVGDTALKNTYTVFRASPPSVGFADLPGSAGQSGQTTQIPSGGALVTGDGAVGTATPTGPASAGFSASGSGSGNPTSTARSGSMSGSGAAAGSGSGSATTTGSGSVSATSAVSLDPSNLAAQASVTAIVTAGDVNGIAQSQASASQASSGAGRDFTLGGSGAVWIGGVALVVGVVSGGLVLT